jgi:hypothetical protein
MNSYRRLYTTLLEEAGRLSAELIYNWEPKFDLESIKDDLTNSQPSFSFVSHPKNGLEKAYLLLSAKVCISQSNPLSRGGRWNSKAIFLYMKKEESLREMFGLLKLGAAGGPPCGPDLLHLRYVNHETAERGIYMYNGSMIYLIRSHKAKRSTNREFFVARFLLVQLGHLLYKYLVYIRLFIDIHTRELGLLASDCSSYLFRSSREEGSKL